MAMVMNAILSKMKLRGHNCTVFNLCVHSFSRQFLLWKNVLVTVSFLFSCLEANQGNFPRNAVITCIPRIRVIFHRNAPKSFPRIWVNFLGQTGASISSKNSPLLNWHKKSRVRESGAGEKSKSQIDKNLFSKKKIFQNIKILNARF